MVKCGMLSDFLLPAIISLLLSDPRLGVCGDRIEECHLIGNDSKAPRFIDPSPQLKISVERGRFMIPSMACAAEGFTSIEWYKYNSIPYPFDFEYGQTKGHISLKDCNQTVEITNTQKDAIGNYTCRVSNGQESIHRTFQVHVRDPPFTDNPFTISHGNCSNEAVFPGDDVYFFCEFCVGDKAQVTDLRWSKLDSSGNAVPISELSNGASKERGQYEESSNMYSRRCLESHNLPAAVGRGLIIRNVRSKTFGMYELTANYTLNGKIKMGSQNVTLSLAPDLVIEITMAVVVSLGIIFFLITMVTAVCYKHHLTLQLYWKNRFGKIEEHDGMEYDAFISFSDSSDDGSFALAVAELLLQQKYNVWMRDMHAIPGEALIAEEIHNMKQSRRCILIISPDYPSSSHSQVLTDLAADQTLRKRSRIIPILYREVSKELLRGRLAEVVRVCPCITWSGTGESISSQIQTDSSNGCSPSEVHDDNINGHSLSDFNDGNDSACGGGGLPSNSIGGHGSNDRCGSQTVGQFGSDASITGCNRQMHQLTDSSITNGSRLSCHSNGVIRMTSRVGDEDQLIDEAEEDEDVKKRKARLKKLREKYEKRLLLKMPPKRVTTENAASLVV